MNSNDKRNKILFTILTVLTTGFLVTVFYAEMNFSKLHQKELEKTSRVISDAVWTMYKEASDAYLQQAMQDRRYKSLKVFTMNDTLYIDLKSAPANNIEKILINLGFIRTRTFSTDITYNSMKIGMVKAEAYNLLIFRHLNNLIITLLLAVTLLFGKKLHDSRSELEQRVQERTAELVMSEQRYESMFNGSYAVMFLIDPANGKIVDANNAAAKFYGYPLSQLQQMTIYQINTSPVDKLNSDIAMISSEKNNIFHMKHRLASGKIRDVEIYSGPIGFKGNRYLFSIIHDITERRIAEKQISEMNRTLQEKVKTEIDKNRKQEEIIHNQKKLADMGNMISAISHQWRQPLNALGFYVQDIADALETGELDMQYAIRFEEESMNIINYLSSTIDDFRYFFQPDKAPSDIKIVDEIYSLLRLTLAQLQNNHISVSLICRCPSEEYISENLSEKPDCRCDTATVRGYAGEFKQVMANLIYNSIDAIKETGQQAGVIKVEIIADGELVSISICDNGGGIPDSIADHIFTPYFSTKKDSKGTGIGLYMSKAIIEEHMNGRILFENITDGACFTIELPVSDA